MSLTNLNNLSIAELKKLKQIKRHQLKKEFVEFKKGRTKQDLINDILGIEKQRKKIYKAKTKQKTKTFEQYFQESIANKKKPEDTPPYLKKALERALREHEEQFIKEKSALENFAEKKYT